MAIALCWAGCVWSQSGPGSSPPPEVVAEIAGARLQGSGRLRFFGLRIYDARLWSGSRPLGIDDWPGAVLALELEYARDLKGRQIAERSLLEMQRQGPIDANVSERWLAAMTKLFPDVREGDRITGVQRPGSGARFFFNGAFRGEVQDGAFARMFFGIWLSPSTSEPPLRESLFGRSAP